MNSTFITILAQLRALINQIEQSVPNDEPLNVAHGAWINPGLTRSEFIEEAQSIIDSIENDGLKDLSSVEEARLKDYARRIEFLRGHTVPQFWSGNGGQAAASYFLTLHGLRKAIEPALVKDGHAEAVQKLRKLTLKIRGLEATLNALAPRTDKLADMIAGIEKANQAADQLPTDLETLSEARAEIKKLLDEAIKAHGKTVGIKDAAIFLNADLKEYLKSAGEVLEKCETAYSAATSVGLAAAFTERSQVLSKSMWVWVGGLVAALVGGSYFGSLQLHSLSDLLREPTTSPTLVTLNLLLSLLSIGAPVWFAWLATKQVGQRFRLAEDYAFKASVSRAYEGFRRESARVDPLMEKRLLASALTRLDEQPLRLVEVDTHGSPWHDLASSKLVRDAFATGPAFAEQVKYLAEKAITAVSAKANRTPTVATPAVDTEKP